MTLGRRLALGALLAAIPLLAAAEWLRRDLVWRAEIDALVQLASSHMETVGHDACEAAPERFGGPIDRPGPSPEGTTPPFRRRRGAEGPPGREAPRPGIVLWAYDATFASANPRAPALPAELREGLSTGGDVATRALPPGERGGIQVAIRTRWPDGPCAVVSLTRFLPQEGGARSPLVPSALSGPWIQLAAVALVVALATMLAAWPLVRRIRRLTAAVARSASTGYAEPVHVDGNDELAGLARAFDSAGAEVRRRIAELEDSTNALRDFLSNTTHDVMQPLTVLQGHLGTIRRRLERREPTDAGLVIACQEEAHYVASLLHNLTAAARLESGAVPVQLSRLDLRPVVERAVSRHAPLAESRGLSLELAVPEDAVQIDGDVTLLEQAIGNLVHNAVRHNTTGQHVAVVLEASGGAFELRVVDDGPGVDEPQLARLAERSFRTDAARRRDPLGQGLGLTIANEVARRHALDLSFARPAGGGFEVTLRGPTGG